MRTPDGHSGTTSSCPECGAALAPDSRDCWLCHARQSTPSLETKTAQRTALRPWQFSLQSLIVAITMTAVWLGLIVTEPGLGIVVTLLAAPALIRMLFPTHYQRASGTPTTPSEKLMSGAVSTVAALAAVVATLTAGAMALVAACFVSCAVEARVLAPRMPAGSQNLVFFSLLGVSALIGLAAAWLFWRFRPRRGQ
jgi:hypothetical protein